MKIWFLHRGFETFTEAFNTRECDLEIHELSIIREAYKKHGYTFLKQDGKRLSDYWYYDSHQGIINEFKKLAVLEQLKKEVEK